MSGSNIPLHENCRPEMAPAAKLRVSVSQYLWTTSSFSGKPRPRDRIGDAMSREVGGRCRERFLRARGLALEEVGLGMREKR